MSFIEYTLTFGLDIVLLAATLSYICRLLVLSFNNEEAFHGGGSFHDSRCAGLSGVNSTGGNFKRSLLNQNVSVRSA